MDACPNATVHVSRRIGISLYLGPGWVIHVSAEAGLQIERAAHRTWRLGLLLAIRRQPSEAGETASRLR